MKPFHKLAWPHLSLISLLSTLAIAPIASAESITVIETHNNFPNGSTSEMVRPSNYTYGSGGSNYHPRYSPPNVVPYRLSPTPEGSPYFSYPKTNSSAPSRTTESRQPSSTMGLTYTSQGGIDYFSMYMDWGNIAIQQNQPQVALNWYQKALTMRPSDKNALRAIQSLQTRK